MTPQDKIKAKIAARDSLEVRKNLDIFERGVLFGLKKALDCHMVRCEKHQDCPCKEHCKHSKPHYRKESCDSPKLNDEICGKCI